MSDPTSQPPTLTTSEVATGVGALAGIVAGAKWMLPWASKEVKNWREERRRIKAEELAEKKGEFGRLVDYMQRDIKELKGHVQECQTDRAAQAVELAGIKATIANRPWCDNCVQWKPRTQTSGTPHP